MSAPDVLKVVLTNRNAAKAKYGASGWRRIRAAVTTLVKADAARGIATRFFALDSAADCRNVGATPITEAGDAEKVKATIDSIFATRNPAYLMLLGGPELVPLVNLANPLWTGDPSHDPDPTVPSDLPYACDSPYTLTASSYRGPTRVVGRLADLTGDTDPEALLVQLHHAATAGSVRRASPEPVFAVSAKVWVGSTTKSVAGLPDVSGAVRTSPTDGPAWTAADVAPRVHFVNCHGAEFDPNWYGQVAPSNWNLPVAIAAANVTPSMVPGQVVAAECCYGTAHWHPSAAGGQASVALSYLLGGASGVFGSSTVAYGPASTTEYADVICRLFVEQVLGGASIGRAALVARQRFIQSQAFLDPIDVKTLAQFALLGDPSAVPFVTGAGVAPGAGGAGGTAAATKTALRRALVSPPMASRSIRTRRDTLTAIGEALHRTTVSCSATSRPRAQMTHRSLAALLGRTVPPDTVIRAYDAERAAGPLPRGLAPRAQVAFLPPMAREAASLVVVREDPGGPPDVRVVLRR
jgi:hypothetical protein